MMASVLLQDLYETISVVFFFFGTIGTCTLINLLSIEEISLFVLNSDDNRLDNPRVQYLGGDILFTRMLLYEYQCPAISNTLQII